MATKNGRTALDGQLMAAVPTESFAAATRLWQRAALVAPSQRSRALQKNNGRQLYADQAFVQTSEVSF